MPSVPPVMTATLPSSLVGIVFPCSCGVPRNFPRSRSFVFWEGLSEHRGATFRLLFCGLVLNHIPMLHEYPVHNAHDIRSNPIRRSTETTKSSMHDHEVSLSHDRSRLVLQRWWKALDEIEQTVAARCDMSAVLNVARRPVALGRCIVTLVEESVKSLKNDCLVLFLFSLAHCFFLSNKTARRSFCKSSRSIVAP